MTIEKDRNPAAVRISRTAKGEKPVNFADPAVDKLLGITMSLASEVSVLRDRLDTLERLIDRHGLVRRSDIESFEPSPAERAERIAARAEFVERILLVVQRDLEESQTGRVARPLKDIIADYAARKI